MSRYPQAVWRPVTRYQSGSLHVAMTPRRLVLHTAVSGSASLFDFFNVSGRATPHFYVNDAGELEQYIDTDFRGTANLDGNHDCIGVESSDEAGKRKTWTDAQVEALTHLAVWCHTEHGIPLVRLPSSRPGTEGIGWHRLGIDGNFPDPPGGLLGGRVTGGESWTLSPGKVCPFDGKIHGIVDRIIPGALALSEGQTDMDQSEHVAGTQLTVGEALAILPELKRKAEREQNRDAAQTKLLRSLVSDLPDQVAAAVEAHLPTDGSTITRAMIREAARKGAASGVTDAYRKAFGTDTPAPT